MIPALVGLAGMVFVLARIAARRHRATQARHAALRAYLTDLRLREEAALREYREFLPARDLPAPRTSPEQPKPRKRIVLSAGHATTPPHRKRAT